MSSQHGDDVAAVAGDDAADVRDRDAREFNVATGRALAEAVRTTLGPKGLDKMLVADDGKITITNDGVTILREMYLDNATAEMIVEAAETQEREAGDGTTTAVVVAGALLAAADDLAERGVHPTTVIDGYRRAIDRLIATVDDLSRAVDPDDPLLGAVAETSLTGTKTEVDRAALAGLIVDAVGRVEAGTARESVHVEVHSRLADSSVLDGVVLDYDPIQEAMPTAFEAASVLLLTSPLELEFDTKEELTADVEASVDDIEDREAFLEYEAELLAERVDRIADLGADVVLCGDDVDDRVAHALAERGILAVSNVMEKDLSRMRRVAGAAVTDLEDAREGDLGTASIAMDEDIDRFRAEAPGGGHVTLLLADPSVGYRGEFERAVEDAVAVVADTVDDGRVVPGGGAVEAELALRLRDHAGGIEGREQLAVEAFADALEEIPRTLARSAGLDPIDTLVDLRGAHDEGRAAAGLDLSEGAIVDALDAGIVEPAGAKTQALSAGAEVANRVLKIDEILPASDLGMDEPGDG